MTRPIACILCLLVSTEAFGLLIDDFSDGEIEIQVNRDQPIENVIQTSLDSSSTIGGRRAFALLFNSGAIGDVGIVRVDTNAETLRFEANGLSGFERYSMAWRGGRDSNAMLNADLLADGSDAFRIDIVEVSGPFGPRLSLSVVSGFDEGVGVANSRRVRWPVSLTPYSMRVPFSAFPDVDFRDVDAIGFSGSGGGFTFTLDAFRTVPEPGAIVLLILGVAFLSRSLPASERVGTRSDRCSAR